MTVGRRVLVVDDEADIRDLASALLRRDGHQVSTADSGAEAIRQVIETKFDLILLDINMPGQDGWQTLRQLKADEATAATPVALFTVRAEIRDKTHGLQYGAVDYIVKTRLVADLGPRVRAILAQAEVAASSPRGWAGGAP